MRAQVAIFAVSLAWGVAMAREAAPQNGTKAAAPATATTPGEMKTTPAEMKTMTYKGVLVDMSCGASASSAAPASSDSQPANAANRAAADSSHDCPVKAESTQLGMKMTDGRVLRFDLVGNQRAQDELKSNKRWGKDLGANKPIQATVSGVIAGEKLIVSSIH